MDRERFVIFHIPAILSVYDQLARWASAPGRRQAGAPREVYRPDAEPLFAAAGQQICDVALPFTVMPPAVLAAQVLSRRDLIGMHPHRLLLTAAALGGEQPARVRRLG
jgi:hypothetical protein